MPQLLIISDSQQCVYNMRAATIAHEPTLITLHVHNMTWPLLMDCLPMAVHESTGHLNNTCIMHYVIE